MLDKYNTAINGMGNIVNSPCSKVEITLVDDDKEVVVTASLPEPPDLDPQSERFDQRVLLYSAQFLPLIGREGVMESMRSFVDVGYFDTRADRESRRVSVGILSGGGGSGKTRVAYELCKEYGTKEQGWAVGFLDEQSLEQITDVLRKGKTFRWDKPTLLVVDYAATRSDKIGLWLRGLASQKNPSCPFRLLLLEREASPDAPWVKAMLDGISSNEKEHVHDIFNYEGTAIASSFLKLSHLSTDDGIKIFTKVLDKLNVSYKEQDLPDENKLMELTAGGRPLYLMMMALTVKDIGFPRALALNRSGLLKHFADKEYERLKLLAQNGNNKFSPELIGHLVACLTVMQGVAADNANELHHHLKAFINTEKQETGYTDNVGNTPDIVKFLQNYFPGATKNEIGYIVPDPIGESFLLEHLQGDADAFLRCCEFMDSQYAANGLASAVHCVQDFEDSSKPVEWLTAYLEKNVDTIAPLLQFINIMPEQTVALRNLALECQKRITIFYREKWKRDKDVSVLPDLAMSLNNLASRLSEVGLRKDALAAAQEAVKYYRELTEQNRDAFLPDLVASVNNLGNALRDVGRHKEALAAAEEAVEYSRELTEQNRDAFLLNLATSVQNLANSLRTVGRYEDALVAAQEAIKYYRELTERNRDAYLLYLARSLNNLGGFLWGVGRYEEVLAAVQEAVKYRRELTERNRDAFLPDLANSINNLANFLSEVGRYEDALVAAEEAVEYSRELAERNRDAFLPYLAASVNNLGSFLSAVGRYEDALAAAQEAVEYSRELAERNRDAFLPYLAASVNNLGSFLSEVGRYEEALVAAQEAVTYYRELAEQYRGAFLPKLTISLNVLAMHLRNLNREKEAVQAEKEAQMLQKELDTR